MCGGVPADSRTCAIIVVELLADSAVVDAVSVMVDPVGASSGTLWQATHRSTHCASAAERRLHPLRVNIKITSILWR